MKKLILLLSIVFHLPLSGMTIDRVILATNNNENYIEFWPVVAKAWQKMGIRPTLGLIATSDVTVDETLGDVIRFEPIPGLAESTQAQAIRLLLPAYFPDDVCILSDIDMLPLNRDYFFNSVKEFPDDLFVVFKDRAYTLEMKQYPMCYNVAKGSTYAKVFQVKNVRHIQAIMQGWCALELGWNTDEKVMWQVLQRWNGETQKMKLLGHTVERRLDRADWRKELIEVRDYYIDCHMPRPYSQYKEEIDQVVREYFP
jgi:hypothetical protein